MTVQTPTVLDTYARLMVPAFDEKAVIDVSTAFQSLFGGPSGITIESPSAEVLAINISRGNERTAKFVVRGADAQDVGPDMKDTTTQQFTEIDRVFPLIEERGVITANQLNKRLMQEQPFTPFTKVQRAQILAVQDHNEHVKRIIRKKELAASEAFRTAKMTVTEGTTAEQIDFFRNSNLEKALTNPFSNPATDVQTEILTGCQAIRSLGRMTADGIIMGSQSFVDFYNREDIQTLADNRRLSFHSLGRDPGQMPKNPQFDRLVAGGAQWEGWIKIGAWTLNIFTYIDGYTNDAGAFTLYMPTDETIIFASGARRDRYYGPSDILPPDELTNMLMSNIFGISPGAIMSTVPEGIKNPSLVDPRMFYLSVIKYEDKSYQLKTQCAPLYAPIRVDTTYLMTNTA